MRRGLRYVFALLAAPAIFFLTGSSLRFLLDFSSSDKLIGFALFLAAVGLWILGLISSRNLRGAAAIRGMHSLALFLPMALIAAYFAVVEPSREQLSIGKLVMLLVAGGLLLCLAWSIRHRKSKDPNSR